jgi:hypothetical protein
LAAGLVDDQHRRRRRAAALAGLEVVNRGRSGLKSDRQCGRAELHVDIERFAVRVKKLELGQSADIAGHRSRVGRNQLEA